MKMKVSDEDLIINWGEMESLLPQLREGDKIAFSKIFFKYYGPVCIYAKKRIGEDHSIIDEIASDAFLQVWQKRKDFPTVKELEAYLFVCIKNDCLDFQKMEKRKRLRERLLLKSSSSVESDADSITPDMMEAFYEELKNLSLQQRQVITLFIEGHKSNEIANQLGLSIKTVQNYRLKALSKLQERISLRLKFNKILPLL